MEHTTIWELPFGEHAELELHTEWGNLTLVPVESGQKPHLELTRGSSDNVAVSVERHGDTVRVSLEPHRSSNWFGGWECRATLYVPRDITAHVQTNAGSIAARDLDGCELGIKANAGKIDLSHIRGLLHLAADAGSVSGRDIGGFLDIESQAGSVRMEVSELQPGEHRVRAAMGSVRLELARGMDVWLDTHTGLGSVRTNYPSRHGAPVRLVLSTEMGSVLVTEANFDARQRPARAEAPAPTTSQTVPEARRGDPELERILKMVEGGQLSAQDADELLRAMGRV